MLETAHQVLAEGELDIGTNTPLLDALRLACAGGHPVRLDLTDVTFVDVTTARAIWDLLDERRRTGRALEVCGASEPVLRTLRFVGVLRLR